MTGYPLRPLRFGSWRAATHTHTRAVSLSVGNPAATSPPHTHTPHHTPSPAVSLHILITFARLGRVPNDCRIALLFVRNQVPRQTHRSRAQTACRGLMTRDIPTHHVHVHSARSCRVGAVYPFPLPHPHPRASLTACSAAFMSSSGTIVMPKWIGRRIALCAAVHPPPLHTHTAPTLATQGATRPNESALSTRDRRRGRKTAVRMRNDDAGLTNPRIVGGGLLPMGLRSPFWSHLGG